MLYLSRLIFILLMMYTSMSSYTSCYAESSTPFVAFDSGGVMQAVLTHVTLLQHGEVAEAYHELSTQYFRSVTPIEQFTDCIPTLPPIVDERQVALENITFGGQAAIYQGRLLNLQAEPIILLNYLLLYEQGRWRVHGLRMTPYPTPPAIPAKKHLARPYLRNI
jgi:hypothetical protein